MYFFFLSQFTWLLGHYPGLFWCRKEMYLIHKFLSKWQKKFYFAGAGREKKRLPDCFRSRITKFHRMLQECWQRNLESRDIQLCKACCSVAQSCPVLCNPMDCSLPGSSVHWILQARILEWVATCFSKEVLLIHEILVVWVTKNLHAKYLFYLKIWIRISRWMG